MNLPQQTDPATMPAAGPPSERVLSPTGQNGRLVREARRPFAALVATYSLSVMNDQLFKETAMLLVLKLSMSKAWQGYIQLTFMFSFVLLAAPVGWLADRFAKRAVVFGSRLMECLSAILGAIGLLMNNWTVILLAIGFMGIRGAIFSPAINGSIPELYPDEHVTRANGILKVFTTASMLAGIALAGFALDLPGTAISHTIPASRAAIAMGIVGLSLLGILASRFLPHKPAAAPAAPFPYGGPATTFATYRRLRADRLLLTIIFTNGYFWFLGSLLVLLINALGVSQFGYSTTKTSYLVVSEVVGMAIGGTMAGKMAAGPRWYRVLAPAGIGMAVFLMLIACSPFVPPACLLPVLLVTFALAGVAGGLFMVPQESFIQVRPPAQEKGIVIASANFASFSGMLLAAPVSMLLGRFAPSQGIAIAGFATLLVACTMWVIFPRKERYG